MKRKDLKLKSVHHAQVRASGLSTHKFEQRLHRDLFGRNWNKYPCKRCKRRNIIGVANYEAKDGLCSRCYDFCQGAAKWLRDQKRQEQLEPRA